MSDDGRDPGTMRRRDFLNLAGTAAAMTAVGGLGACAPANEGPGVVEVSLDSVPEDGRLEVVWGEMPVELRRTPDGVEARSLWCTHSGCRVKWRPDEQIYFCICHDGKYDAAGAPIAGPPPRPLSDIPFEVDGTTIRLGVET